MKKTLLDLQFEREAMTEEERKQLKEVERELQSHNSPGTDIHEVGCECKEAEYWKGHADRMSREQGTIMTARLACENMRKERDEARADAGRYLEGMQTNLHACNAAHVAHNETHQQLAAEKARADAAEREARRNASASQSLDFTIAISRRDGAIEVATLLREGRDPASPATATKCKHGRTLDHEYCRECFFGAIEAPNCDGDHAAPACDHPQCWRYTDRVNSSSQPKAKP